MNAAIMSVIAAQAHVHAKSTGRGKRSELGKDDDDHLPLREMPKAVSSLRRPRYATMTTVSAHSMIGPAMTVFRSWTV